MTRNYNQAANLNVIPFTPETFAAYDAWKLKWNADVGLLITDQRSTTSFYILYPNVCL